MSGGRRQSVSLHGQHAGLTLEKKFARPSKRSSSPIPLPAPLLGGASSHANRSIKKMASINGRAGDKRHRLSVVRQALKKAAVRSRGYQFLNNPNSSVYAKRFDVLFTVIVIVNVILFMMSTVPGYDDQCPGEFSIVERRPAPPKCSEEVKSFYLSHSHRKERWVNLSQHDCCIQCYDWGMIELTFTVIFSIGTHPGPASLSHSCFSLLIPP